MNEQKERAVALIQKRKEVDEALKQLAREIDPVGAQHGWKKVLREQCNIVI